MQDDGERARVHFTGCTLLSEWVTRAWRRRVEKCKKFAFQRARTRPLTNAAHFAARCSRIFSKDTARCVERTQMWPSFYDIKALQALVIE